MGERDACFCSFPFCSRFDMCVIQAAKFPFPWSWPWFSLQRGKSVDIIVPTASAPQGQYPGNKGLTDSVTKSLCLLCIVQLNKEGLVRLMVSLPRVPSFRAIHATTGVSKQKKWRRGPSSREPRGSIVSCVPLCPSLPGIRKDQWIDLGRTGSGEGYRNRAIGNYRQRKKAPEETYNLGKGGNLFNLI